MTELDIPNAAAQYLRDLNESAKKTPSCIGRILSEREAEGKEFEEAKLLKAEKEALQLDVRDQAQALVGRQGIPTPLPEPQWRKSNEISRGFSTPFIKANVMMGGAVEGEVRVREKYAFIDDGYVKDGLVIELNLTRSGDLVTLFEISQFSGKTKRWDNQDASISDLKDALSIIAFIRGDEPAPRENFTDVPM